MDSSVHHTSQRVTAANNPFSQQRLERLAYRFPNAEGWESNLANLGLLNHRASIVGARGTGKSTLLRELHLRLNSAAPADRPQALLLDIPRRTTIADRSGLTRQGQLEWLHSRLAEAQQQTWILIDGLERLCWRDGWCLTRRWASPQRCAGLVVTLHRPQRTLQLAPWVRTRPTADLVSELLIELGVSDIHWQQRAHHLWKTCCHRSVRDVFRRLYDEYRA